MILVSGATGNVGRTLVHLLTEAGAPVTAVSRGITAAAVPGGVRAVAADLTVPASLRPALHGAEALFLLISGDFVAATGHPGNTVTDILRDAADAGVKRVVLLSSQGVVTRPESLSHGVMGKAVEDAVRQSGPDWTILRPGGFHSNAYAWSEPIRTRRTVAAPFADVGLPSVDPDDIAAVAVAALLEEDHAGQIYELTGPARITPRQRAAAIGQALGEPVGFREQTRDEALAQMLRFMPEPVAETTLSILGRPSPAELRISPDVERVLHRAPRSFAEWAGRTIATFR